MSLFSRREAATTDVSVEEVRRAAGSVLDPELQLTLADAGMLGDVAVDRAGSVRVTVRLTTPTCPMRAHLVEEVVAAVRPVAGVTRVDVAAINARMAQINAHIQGKAAEHGYAYFALSALYDLPKPSFDLYQVLFSNAPFGPNISLDGVHPTAQGQAILAAAAVQAINARYGLGIP